MNQFNKYIKSGVNLIETVKLTVLVGGIIFGIFMDINSPDIYSIYHASQYYQQPSHLITSISHMAYDTGSTICFSELRK